MGLVQLAPLLLLSPKEDPGALHIYIKRVGAGLMLLIYTGKFINQWSPPEVVGADCALTTVILREHPTVCCNLLHSLMFPKKCVILRLFLCYFYTLKFL